MDDDIWDDCDDSEYEKIMAERNYNRMNEINQNMGYVQGLDYGKENTIQEGFETGFKIGFDNGSKLGEQYGEVSALKFLTELDKNNNEKINLIFTQFNEKYKNYKNIEPLYEAKKLNKVNHENNEIYMPVELKSFMKKNNETLNSM